MTSVQLLSYQIEYETSDITIIELCDKYQVKKKQLKGYTKWKKPQHEEKELIVPEAYPIVLEAINQPDEENTLLTSIQLFKKRAVEYALDSITEPQYLEIREFKDLVSIIDTVEKSIKGTEGGNNTVNIMVQNIMNKYADDC